LLDVDQPLVLPANQKVRFLVTANDVIHAWWVPAFAVKRDAMPGYVHEAWATINHPGVYRGQCAELCGMHHGYMPIVVNVLPRIEFDAWMKQKQDEQAKLKAAANMRLTKDELMDKGKKAYETTCAACHQANGVGMPAANIPALKGSKIAIGPLADHLHIVLHGKAGTAMQAFGAQLDDVTIAAIITYERNAWDNDKLDTKYPTVVQPADVIAARQDK
jgi:cytochrome c oxidase subunit 2